MPDRYSAKVGEAFTLDAHFTVDDELADVSAISKIEIQDEEENVIETVSEGDITRVSEGVYRASVPALAQGGDLHDVWYYTPVTDAEEEVLYLDVTVKEFEGEEGEEEAEADPDLPDDDVCTITATFRDASGAPKQGVYVRFTPQETPDSLTAHGFILGPVTGESDVDGEFSMRLIRGLVGTLTVSGVGIVRTVTIPDQETIDLFTLTATADDPFEVQDLDDFIELPRRS